MGVVCLTMGSRPAELTAALASVAAQSGVMTETIVVGNGWAPAGLPPGMRSCHLPENLGIPAGRNRGVPHVAGQYLLFLDDDASIPSTTFLSDAIARLVADPSIGLIQPRVVDPTGAANPRRWVPRIRKGDPKASSDVFSVWEGVVVMPRAVFEATGGWGEPYFYAHEGIELAWRVWDAGFRVRYAGDLVAHHPAIAPTRHAHYFRLTARNRVWLARRNLPWLLAPLYVASWTAIQTVRFLRRPEGARAWWGGWLAGWRDNPGGRRPLSWSTVARMTRAGRAPIV